MDLFGEETIPAGNDGANKTELTPESAADSYRLLPPAKMNDCLGHDEIKARMLALLNSQAMPHTLALCGPRGIGKATLAYNLSKLLLQTNKPEEFNSFNFDPSDRNVRLVSANTHLDMKIIECACDPGNNTKKSTIGVNDVRVISGFLNQAAAEGGWRIVLIDDADTMNNNAQNALLKVLEEPPRQTLIIMIAHNPGMFIPTIRSRTQFFKLNGLSDKYMQELMARAVHDPITEEKKKLILDISEGSIGRALELMQDGNIDVITGCLQDLGSVIKQKQWGHIHMQADRLAIPANEKSYKVFQETFLWFTEQCARTKARGEGLLEHLAQLSGLEPSRLKNLSLEDFLKICQNLQELFQKSNQGNLDRKQTVLKSYMLLSDTFCR